MTKTDTDSQEFSPFHMDKSIQKLEDLPLEFTHLDRDEMETITEERAEEIVDEAINAFYTDLGDQADRWCIVNASWHARPKLISVEIFPDEYEMGIEKAVKRSSKQRNAARVSMEVKIVPGTPFYDIRIGVGIEDDDTQDPEDLTRVLTDRPMLQQGLEAGIRNAVGEQFNQKARHFLADAIAKKRACNLHDTHTTLN